MSRRLVAIRVPDSVGFADLKLARDPTTGAVSFDWGPIDAVCAESGIDPALFRDQDEDNVAGLIVAWYAEHCQRCGAPDRIAEQLIAEVAAEEIAGIHGVQQSGNA